MSRKEAAAYAPVVETVGLSKNFGSIQALSGISISINAGEIVALVGDNGAGKSTLVNILSGALAPSSGSIFIGGEPVTLRSPIEARQRGIETVYQDLALATHLPVWANVFFGRERTVRGPLGWLGWLDKKTMMKRSVEELARTSITIGSVETNCGRLSGGQRQAIAIARAITWGSRLLLMDEPTAALGVEQQEQVATLVRAIRDRGIPVMLISHNLLQVHDLCDRILVLFRGELVADLRAAETSIEETVLWITGGGRRGKEAAGRLADRVDPRP